MDTPADDPNHGDRVIVPFPASARPWHHSRLQRSTVRFARVTKQLPLPLPAESSLDQRIAAAKATSANYEDMAERVSDPGRKRSLCALAAKWHDRAEALIAERANQGIQQELLPS